MNAIKHIRKNLLGLQQKEFAQIADASQASVSRWEKDKDYPNLHQLKMIKKEAISRGVEWNDSLFFAEDTDES